jgi:hypothetical protein
VPARQVIEKNFSGFGSSALQVVVPYHSGRIADDPAAQADVRRAAKGADIVGVGS